MKKIILALCLPLLLASFSLQAEGHKHKHHQDGGKNSHGMAMKHANPLPNLMRVVMKHGDELYLNKQQRVALKQWREANSEPMHKLVMQVIKAEKALHQAALADASMQQLQDLMDKVLGLRLQVAKGKISCRENMRSILDQQQWQRVVQIYQRMMESPMS